VAQDTEDDAKTTLDTATEHLHLLGSDPDARRELSISTPAFSGVITDQEVTNAAFVQAYSTPNPFTISDLTTVWIVCDVYENDMANVRVGEPADIKLNAYPAKVLKGTISNIGSILDPNIRTAKVRIEVANPWRDDAAGDVCHGTLSARRSRPTRLCLRPRSCICTTAIGSSFPLKRSSSGLRSSVANSCRTTCRRFYPGCSPASRW